MGVVPARFIYTAECIDKRCYRSNDRQSGGVVKFREVNGGKAK